MAAEKAMTSVEFEQLVRSVDLSRYKAAMASTATAASRDDIITQICDIYKIVRPILSGLLALPFIPENVKEIVRAFMGLLDGLCPAH